MKITGLIDYLYRIKNKYGDIPVYICQDYEEPYGTLIDQIVTDVKTEDIKNVLFYKDGHLIVDTRN